MKASELKEHYKSLQVTTALKIVLSGIICILINNLFHLELEYFSLLFVMLIILLAHGEVFKAGSQTIVGCIISGIVSLLIAYFLLDSRVVFILLMSVWIFLIVALLVKNFLVLLISSVSATMIMYDAIYSSIADAESVFTNYVVQLILAVIVSSIVDGLVWPNRSRRVLQLTLKTVYDDFSELFESYTEELSKRKSHLNTSIRLITFSHLVTYANRMQKEEGGENFPIDEYLKLITYSRGVFIKVEVLEEYVLKQHAFMKTPEVDQELNHIFSIFSKSFEVLSTSIGTKDIVNINEQELNESISSLHEIYRNMHEKVGEDNEYYEDLLVFGAMLPVLDDISNKIFKIRDAVNMFHSVEYDKMLASRVTHTKNIEKVRISSFFKIDKDAAKVGIKTVVIFLILMFGEAIFGLPGGGQVVFFAIVFGVIPNLGQAYMKSRYGILGVTLGLIMSFVSLTILSIAPRFLIVVCLYSLGTFIAAYIASSSRDISLTGLQAGLLFPFGILYTIGPDVDIHEAYTRFLALFSAVLIGLIVQHILWPSNPYKLLKQKISKSISYSGQILSILLADNLKDTDKVDKMILPLAASLPTTSALLHDAEYLIREDDLHGEEFIHIIEMIERTYAELETVKRAIYDNKDSKLLEGHRKVMQPVYLQLNNMFDQISEQFNNKEDFTMELSQLKNDLESKRSEYRDSGVWRSADPKDIEELVLLTTTMDGLLKALSQISEAIASINKAKLEQKHILEPSKA